MLQVHEPLMEKGLLLLLQKRYPAAVSLLEAAVIRNPLQAATHRTLGLAYMRTRRFSEAYQALMASLFFASSPKEGAASIGLLSIIATGNTANQTTPSKFPAWSHPLWDDLDEILIARLPLEEAYRFKGFKSEDALVKVLHDLLEKLPETVPASDTNFAMQVYSPLFSRLFQKDDFDPLVQYAFSGYGIEEVDKAADRNKREVTAVREQALRHFNRLWETEERFDHKRSTARPTRYFLSSGENLTMTSNLLSTEPVKWGAGKAQVFEEGILLGEGVLNAEGKKTGDWNYYYKNGRLHRTVTYVNDKAEGVSRSYSHLGIPSEVSHMRTIRPGMKNIMTKVAG